MRTTKTKNGISATFDFPISKTSTTRTLVKSGRRRVLKKMDLMTFGLLENMPKIGSKVSITENEQLPFLDKSCCGDWVVKSVGRNGLIKLVRD